jgi:UrcA family protein
VFGSPDFNRGEEPLMRATLIPALAFAAATAAAAGPAAAQYAYGTPAYGAYVDELVVVGPSDRYDRDGRPTRLSQAVSFRDLDLAVPEDRRILNLRIRDTARDLCRALGESGSGSVITPSCVDRAVRDARPQVRVAVNQAYARSEYASAEYGRYAYVPY